MATIPYGDSEDRQLTMMIQLNGNSANAMIAYRKLGN